MCPRKGLLDPHCSSFTLIFLGHFPSFRSTLTIFSPHTGSLSLIQGQACHLSVRISPCLLACPELLKYPLVLMKSFQIFFHIVQGRLSMGSILRKQMEIYERSYAAFCNPERCSLNLRGVPQGCCECCGDDSTQVSHLLPLPLYDLSVCLC